MIGSSSPVSAVSATGNQPLARPHSMRMPVAVAGVFAVGVFLISEVTHSLLVPDLGRHAERMTAETVSALIVGCIAAMLFHIDRERRDAAQTRRQVIAEMNHHVRNALMPISLSVDVDQKESVHFIVEGVERIEWALREILPRLNPLPEAERTRLLYCHGNHSKTLSTEASVPIPGQTRLPPRSPVGSQSTNLPQPVAAEPACAAIRSASPHSEGKHASD